jgi:hypothetical protein
MKKPSVIIGSRGVFADSLKTAVPRNSPAPRRPFRLTPDQANTCHDRGWTGAEIDTFLLRSHLFARRRLAIHDAADLAELLLLRDRLEDKRRLCIECLHGMGTRCPAGYPIPGFLLNHCHKYVSA